jgi:hypothetical protein
MALNLELSVAVTHNFVSKANLGSVVTFLRDRKEEVAPATVPSRARDDGFHRKPISADGLHQDFLAALATKRPDLAPLVAEAVASPGRSRGGAGRATLSAMAGAFNRNRHHTTTTGDGDDCDGCDGDLGGSGGGSTFSFGF